MQAPGGPTGPIGTTRNPIMLFVIAFVTCGLGGLYYTYAMAKELKEFLQTDEINPIFMLIFPLNLLLTLKLPGFVLEAKKRAGVPNPTEPSLIMYLFLILWVFPNDLNEIWEAAQRNK